MTFFGLFQKSKSKEVITVRDESSWIAGFESGFNKAWDMMVPFMTDGVSRIKEHIRNKAIDETLENLETTVAQRVSLTGNHALVAVNEVLTKKRDFEAKLANTKDESQKAKYRNYIDTLDWVLNGNILQKAE